MEAIHIPSAFGPQDHVIQSGPVAIEIRAILVSGRGLDGYAHVRIGPYECFFLFPIRLSTDWVPRNCDLQLRAIISKRIYTKHLHRPLPFYCNRSQRLPFTYIRNLLPGRLRNVDRTDIGVTLSAGRRVNRISPQSE